jgi:DNA-binding transcriptional LysR family regulator
LQQGCTNFRHGPTELGRWELQKAKKELSVAVNGPLIVDDLEMVLRAALDGIGLAFMAEHEAPPYLAEGRLVRVLQDWCQPFPTFFIYYPSRRQQTGAFTALIQILRS